MKSSFTLLQIGLMIAALNKLEGNKRLLLKLIKLEDALTLTPEEQERTGTIMTDGNLLGPPGCGKLKVTRGLALEELVLIKSAVDTCRTWQGKFKREVIALSKKLDKLVTEEQAVVAWNKLPKKERKRLQEAEEKKKDAT